MFRKIPKNICRICEKSDVELINITLTESKWIVDRFLNLAANVSVTIIFILYFLFFFYHLTLTYIFSTIFTMIFQNFYAKNAQKT